MLVISDINCFVDKMGMSNVRTNVSFFLEKMKNDPNLVDIRHAAYMVATTMREAGNFNPKEEKGGMDYYCNTGKYAGIKGKSNYCGAGNMDPYGVPYIGRGYCQTTWKGNYEKFGKLLGVDLVNNPRMACEPNVAYEVMSNALLNKSAPAYTGVKLWKYINNEKTDFVNARRTVNSLDSAESIARNAEKALQAFKDCGATCKEGGTQKNIPNNIKPEYNGEVSSVYQNNKDYASKAKEPSGQGYAKSGGTSGGGGGTDSTTPTKSAEQVEQENRASLEAETLKTFKETSVAVTSKSAGESFKNSGSETKELKGKDGKEWEHPV